MKKKQGFVLQHLANEYVIIGAGKVAISFNKVIRLNQTSAFLWEAMGDKEFTMQQLVDALRNEYDVDDATANDAVKKMIDSLRTAGVIDE